MTEPGWRRLFRLGVGRGRLRREVDDELAFHLEMRTQKLIAAGMTPDSAREQARRQFGDVDAIRDDCLTLDNQLERAVRRANFLEELRRDVAYALRTLGSHGGFTAVVILTLGIGIGATTAIFSLVDALLLRQLPVARPEQLIAIGRPNYVNAMTSGAPSTDLFSYPLYRDLRERNRLVTGLLASGRTPRLTAVIPGSVSGSDSSGTGEEHPRGRFVSANYFHVLGVQPAAGRVFVPDDATDGASEPAVVISHGYWRRRFALDPSAIGRTITLNKTPVTIIGVAPEGFFGDVVGLAPDLWIPLGIQSLLMPNERYLEKRDVNWLMLMGRLAPGVTLLEARAGFTQMTRQALEEQAGTRGDPAGARELARRSEVEVHPGDKGFSRIRLSFGQPLLVLMAGAVLVLMIVCANVANLLLARAAARRTEVGVRLALGAARARLVRQLLTESAVLALGGAGAGLMLAWWGSTALLRVASPTSTPIPLAAQIDLRVLAFAGGIALLTLFIFGLAPALRATRVDLAEALKARTRGGTGGALAATGRGLGAGKLLVIAQVALSVLLLIGAGLLVRTTQQLGSTDLGYERDGLVIADVLVGPAGYEGERLSSLATLLLERFRLIPGVQSVSYSENGLFNGTESSTTVHIAGYSAQTEEDTLVNYDHVGPDYLKAIGARLLSGRDISDRDVANSRRVMVINSTMARFYFPGQDPVGRVVGVDSLEYEVVGVAADVKGLVLRDEPTRRFYAPYQQAISERSTLRFEIRTNADLRQISRRVRGEVAAVDASLGIGIDPLVDLMRASIGEERLFARLATFFGGLALLLAVIGLYGVMTYTIVRRTAEFGLRQALGARPRDVVSLVLRESLALVLLGALIGIPASIAAANLIRSQLFGVSPLDPITIAFVLLVLTTAAAVAAFLPANRASRVAPLDALRAE